MVSGANPPVLTNNFSYHLLPNQPMKVHKPFRFYTFSWNGCFIVQFINIFFSKLLLNKNASTHTGF